VITIGTVFAAPARATTRAQVRSRILDGGNRCFERTKAAESVLLLRPLSLSRFPLIANSLVHYET